MSQGNKVVMYLFAIVFVAFGVFAAVAAARAAPPALIIGLVPMVLGVFFIREAMKLSLVVDDTSLTVTHAFSTRSVLLDEISGYRKGSKDTILLDLKSGERALTIPNSIERRSELIGWLKGKYPDIDAERAKEVTEAVLHDDRYGDTEEERAAKLAMAKKLMIYSAVAPLLFIWVIIDPQPFRLLMLILLAIPVLAVWLTWYYKGILQVFVSNKRPYPSLIVGIIGTVFAALIAIIRVYKVYLFGGHGLLLLVGCSIVLTLLWAIACRAALEGDKNPFVVYGGMLLIAGVYAYNALLFINCSYDTNPPEKWRVGVDRKYAQHGRSTSYWLDLSPWGRYDAGKSVSVEYKFYHSVAEGDTVNVLIHPGECGIAWYEVMK